MIQFPISLILLFFASSIASLSNNDLITLKGKLKDYIAENPDRRIPVLVRQTFHDLFLQNQAGYHGCIIQPDFMGNQENLGLSETIMDLQKIVKRHFPNSGFSFGDVIAFAGKVAIEAAYPCMDIEFNYNRSPCTQSFPNITNQPPSGFISSISNLTPTLEYLGGSITAQDMAILFAGAHGIKGAAASPSGWVGTFSTFSSGKDFISTTFNSTWKGTTDDTLFEFFKGDTFEGKSSIIRLPSDMIFYPSKNPFSLKPEKEAVSIQEKLKSYTTQDRSIFDKEFEKVFSKMLKIGGGDAKFVREDAVGVCASSPQKSDNGAYSEKSQINENGSIMVVPIAIYMIFAFAFI